MARKPTITQEQVNDAANQLIAAGQTVTNRAILEKLGSGSMATVVSLVQNWRSGQVRTSAMIDDAIDPDVSKSISNMMAKKISEATAEANAKIAELQNDLTSVINENERQAIQIDEQQAELEQLRGTVQNQSGQIEQLSVDLIRAQEHAAGEAKSREAAVVSLAKAELQIESLPVLKADLAAYRAKFEEKSVEAAELRGRLAEIKPA